VRQLPHLIALGVRPVAQGIDGKVG